MGELVDDDGDDVVAGRTRTNDSTTKQLDRPAKWCVITNTTTYTLQKEKKEDGDEKKRLLPLNRCNTSIIISLGRSGISHCFERIVVDDQPLFVFEKYF